MSTARNRAKLPPAPEHLSEEAVAWWARINTDYTLSSHHLKLLQVACESWDRAQQARRTIDLEGLTVPSDKGVKTHPAIAIERDMRTLFARVVRELQLDTVEAPQQPPPKRSPADAYLGKAK